MTENLDEIYYSKVTLPSNGKTVRIRPAGIFDFDLIGPEVPGIYTYTQTMDNGVEYKIPYDITAIAEEPVLPPGSNWEEGSDEYYQAEDYYLFQDAVAYEINKASITAEQAGNVKKDILDNYVHPDDKGFVITVDDLDTVKLGVMMPEVEMEDIVAALRYSFPVEV